MPSKTYDVLIVGSGHSGGMAANILTKQGADCLMLNAGPEPDFQHNQVQKAVHELPFHGFGQPGRLPHVYQANEYNANQWVDEKEVPYTHDPGNPYNWVRVRLVGGRSLFWARQSFRLSDFEFKAGDLEGTGVNWPVDLAEMDPFYSRVEAIFRVSGRKEGWPEFPDGNFIETQSGPESQTIARMAEIGKQRHGMKLSRMRISVGQNGLASSVNLLLPDAMATGRLQMVSNAIAREITIDKNTGRANGAHFVDRHSRREMHARARVVVLAAGCLESTRLLLNSGLCNSSGVLGHYLHDQIYGVRVLASVPEARDGKRTEGLMGGYAFVPRFRNLTRDDKRNFIKGYCVNLSSGISASPDDFAEYGAELQKKLGRYAGSCVAGSIYGERPARSENHVRINKNVSDAWGIPALHIEVKDGPNELNMAKDAADTLEDVFHTAGWDIISKTDRFFPPGYSIHEVGTCRMGNDPKTSVLNRWNQSHEMKNLFVVDGAGFVTCGWQNPTMTILALSMRASEYLADEMKKRNIG
jgi:choline dehydrogenase-like flavoprotein